jgi:hypothetical protein
MAVLLKWRKILCQDDILNLLPLLNQIYYSSSSPIIRSPAEFEDIHP